MDSLEKLMIDFTLSCINAIVACHLEIFFWDVLNKQLDKINRRKSFPDKRIIFMPVVMESHVIPVVGIDSGKGNDRTSKVSADIFDNRFRVAEIWFRVNIKAIFAFTVYFRLCLFERGADAFLKFIQEDGLERFTEVRVIEVFNGAPEAVVGISAFGKKTVDMRVPFKRSSKGMEDANKTGDKIFRFVQGEKEFFDDNRNGLKKAVEQVTVLKEKRRRDSSMVKTRCL